MAADASPLTTAESRGLIDRERARESFPVENCLHEIFQTQVRNTPSAVALTCDGTSITYEELNRRANRIAHALREQDAGPETIVALYLERSPEMVIGLLGILKAGAAYLPIDPVYPAERIAFMLEDSGTGTILSGVEMYEKLPANSARLLRVDDTDALSRWPDTDPVSGVRPANLAYVIYTSGSTGKPKGCLIEHRNAVRLFSATRRWFDFSAQDVWTLFHSIAFDFTVWELWGALLHGGRLVIVPYDVSRSPEQFYALLSREGVTVLNQTPSAFQMLARAEENGGQRDLALRYVIFGGEALELQSLRPWMKRHGDARPKLINMYGITETTVHVTYRPLSLADLDARAGSVIGVPIPDLGLYILDPERRPVALGDQGEIYVGGAGVARGYLRRPELSAEKFVENPFRSGERLYRTGDLARARPDGDIEYLGRIDLQVKIRGFRVELGEIQSQLARHPRVREVAVVAREDQGEKRLVAYIVPQDGPPPASSVLRQYLAVSLPEYMVPSRFVTISSLPLTANGKVDTRALPAPLRTRPDIDHPYVAPGSPTESLLCAAFAELLEIEPVGVDDNFFHLGGTSLLCVRALSRLRENHGFDIPVARFFQNPTAAELARFLDGDRAIPGVQKRMAARKTGRAAVKGDIAIVGMAGRFPGSNNVDAFWENLCDGVESLHVFSESGLHAKIAAAVRSDPAYVRVRGVIDDFDKFDASFFGITPKEAEMMDPQQRIFLEISWEALERAGYPPALFSGSIAVFAGMYGNSYLTEHLATRPDLIERIGSLHTLILNEKDFIATRVAHRLDLTGPAISVHTACSTSLVAICQAVQSLRSGECDMALAGGASMTCPPESGYLHQDGGMLSADGHTRSFDAKATGTVFSDGAGVVLLRPIEQARAAGDTIYAVIRGTSLNNDGGRRASFTAPSVEGQAAVIAMAQENADVDPRSVSYIEAHGTATPLGDPIEIEALTQAFRLHTQDKGFCAIGSLKSNVGHLVAAAGVAGVIKTALALHHRRIPPSLHFESPNPKLDLANSPFFVPTRVADWPEGPTARRAGVSSFGVGGTNAHVVLEETPMPAPSGPSRPRQLLVLSARSGSALDHAAENLAAHLECHPDISLADAAYTLQVGRQVFAHRRALTVRDTRDAVALLRGGDALRVATRVAGAPPEVAFMFPGQGAQYVAMGRTLYRDNAVFRAVVDRCAEVLRPQTGFDLRTALYEVQDLDTAASALRATSLTQPALFTIEYALAQLWLGLGVRPAALIGHSVGEFVAATLAGVFSLEDALRLVATRGRLMQDLPAGSMLSVRLAADRLAERLTPNLAIASDNGPQLAVAAGPTDEVLKLQAALEGEGVVCRLLQTSHAFHSAMMDPILRPFGDVVRGVKLSKPIIPIVSTVTGAWMSPAQAVDPEYWTQHLRRTVRFAPAVRVLATDEAMWLLLEIGPRATLAALARQQAMASSAKPVVVASLGDALETEWDMLLQGVGQAWTAGVPIDWTAFSGEEHRRRIPLPTYPFERQRYWIEPRIDPQLAALTMPANESIPMSAVLDAPVSNSLVSCPIIPEVSSMIAPALHAPATGRRDRLVVRLRALFEDVSGIEMDGIDPVASFLELGLDSLALTQVALQLQKVFSVKVTFRQLMQDYPNLDSLATYMEQQVPAESAALAPPPAAPAAGASIAGAPSSYLKHVVDTQLQLMAQQLALLGGTPSAPIVTPLPVATPASASPDTVAARDEDAPAGPVTYDVKKAFGAIARIHAAISEPLTPMQKARLDAFVRRYNIRTKSSKKFTQDSRAVMADPRAVTGFKLALKELVYPIVVDRSKGSRLWDIDGNEYIDVLCGFGPCMFGWQPEFVLKALKDQMKRGFELGPQHPLQAEVARQVCEMTGFDRAAFCNTGSEAVMGCMRIARTVTGRNLIAIFNGSYHGVFDEVIVRGTKKLRSVPAAPGIMPSASQNVLVLDYGTPESLEILKARAGELAAIMVEPIQSRRPDFHPREFLHELRTLTEASGTAYIFDEVVTGFRAGPGGAQEFFGLKADIASYGKVIGGGLPIGVIAGKSKYMDALDGGFWQYGDASTPPAGVTYFAGTFVRHPLALAAAHAVLGHLKEKGPELQRSLNERTTRFVAELNALAAEVHAPIKVRSFASLWRASWDSDQPFGDLLFYMMRDRGVHLYDGFPCFFTTAHSEADFAHIAKAFKDSLVELQEGGFVPGRRPGNHPAALDPNSPPVPGARLGRDHEGNPAWFVPNPDSPGKYMRLDA